MQVWAFSDLLKSVLCTVTLGSTEEKVSTVLIKLYPENIRKAVLLSFGLFDKHIRDGLIHLDLWMGNVIVQEDLSCSWLIDLEYFKTGSSRNYYDKFGHCLASFYRHTLCSYLSFDQYIKLLTLWHGNNQSDSCIQQLTKHVELNLSSRMSRKETMAYF